MRSTDRKILGAKQPVSLAEEDFTSDSVKDTVKGKSTVYSSRRKHPMASTHTSTSVWAPMDTQRAIHTYSTHAQEQHIHTD